MSADGPPVRDTPPGASGALAAAPSMVGQTLDGRYRIIRKLGEGGMGEVYAAEHIHIEKRFAIKLLRPEIVSNAEAVQRFRQEARSSSSIGHRNIIAIEDFGQLPDGRIYMCMELLNGAALNDLIQQPQPLDRLLNVMIQTGHGLAAAHAKGIVHRDMKPENIFVTIDANNQDVPKLLDFGIAKVAGNDGQNNLTRTGTIFGTPFYMAPEQALGNPVDARTDVYAMGVIMYEVFGGSLPFQGESFMGILTQHITTEPEPVAARAHKAGRQLPPHLADVITRCMQKNPAQRFATMDDLVNALVQIYRGVAGPGMSTYMEAFPVSARMPAPTPPPMTGQVPSTTPHGYATPGYATPAHPHAAAQTGSGYQVSGSHASSGSGLYSPGVPRKSKAGLVIAIIAVLAVGGGIAAFAVVSNKGTTAGSGSQVAGGDGSDGSGAGGAGTTGGSSTGSSSGSDPWSGSGAGSDTPGSGTAGSGAGSDTAGSDTADTPPPVDAGIAAPAAVSVLLMSKNGVEFEIHENGTKVGEGPDVIAVTPGSPRTVTIRARGFKDKQVVVDGKAKKLTFRLDPIPVDCSKNLVDAKNRACVKQYCTTHKTDALCTKPVDCSASILDPKNKGCVAQFCAKHPEDSKCGLE